MMGACLICSPCWEDRARHGGNSGLGKAMALGLGEAGGRVAVTGRDPQKNAAIAAKLGDDAVFGLDVRDGDSVAATITAVAERFGGLDILVNNAASSGAGPCWP
jgi:NAD(P)-dependent dehydrogenase (short-subunit alcohol dehydrogenase family)